ncbi:MAG TPA: hypothetical protein VNT51_11570 [Miltoncostaeaceae bacterium]|nr:hypothetical protein [Miltoncostaeaceae bacterium]
MFRADCPVCGPVLMWEQRITAVENAADGILMRYVCLCGTPGSILTGRRRPAPAAPAPAETAPAAVAAAVPVTVTT